MYQQNAMSQAVVGSVANASVEARLSFLRKVYTCFTAIVFIWMSTMVVAIQQGWAFEIARMGLGGYLVLFVGVLLCYAVRKVPVLNWFGMAALGVIIGMMMAPIVYIANLQSAGQGVLQNTVFQAFILTAGVFSGLTVYVFTTRKDFSWMGGMLFIGLLMLVLIGLASFFFPIPNALHTAVLVMGVIIFTGYILYDTSVIIHHLSEDEYVLGAMNLFFDFAYLFYYILMLLMNRD